MNCFECAKAGESVPAVGVCRRCGVGLCLEHLAEAEAFTVGGTHYACAHAAPNGEPLRAQPAEVG